MCNWNSIQCLLGVVRLKPKAGPAGGDAQWRQLMASVQSHYQEVLSVRRW